MSLYTHVRHPHADARQKAGPVKVADHYGHLGRVNDAIAKRITIAFGSMWAAYVLFLYGLVPIVDPRHITTYLYWSNVVQLVALPVLMVGAVVLGRAADARAQQQFLDVEAILQGQDQQARHLAAQDDKILALEEKSLAILAAIEANTAVSTQARDAALAAANPAAGGAVSS